jgi:hypothetical protein
VCYIPVQTMLVTKIIEKIDIITGKRTVLYTTPPSSALKNPQHTVIPAAKT